MSYLNHIDEQHTYLCSSELRLSATKHTDFCVKTVCDTEKLDEHGRTVREDRKKLCNFSHKERLLLKFHEYAIFHTHILEVQAQRCSLTEAQLYLNC